MANKKQSETYSLWGTPHSLYTGKLRAYLIKKGVPLREFMPGHSDFEIRIQPMLRLFVVPVLETPSGDILQDTSEIIDYLEAQFPAPLMVPETPVQRALASLICAFSSEALLPAAMHYRWSFRAEQESFLQAEFGRGIALGVDRASRDAAGLALMEYFSGMLPTLGVTPETAPAIEAMWLDLLEALDAHFQEHPYVLGGRPSIADAGLMAPLFAHLARDPIPSAIMKNRAPNVFRWTERMNLAAIADPEFPDTAEAYAANDAIPETLLPVLRLIFQDWTAELQANVAHYKHWLEANPYMPAGQRVALGEDRVTYPTLGPIAYELRGVTVRRDSSTQTLWHFDRALQDFVSLSGAAAIRYQQMLNECGGEAMMAIRLPRRLQREDHQLVLGATDG